MPNRLASETSPYLLQHAHNPVDWYPWGDAALTRAREQDRPIFLSIGYSACHWCHVMEHESFENAEIAKKLNEQFVCVKVDREERPDLDQVYMNAVQLMTGRGGWPMSVFLTPDLEPFYGGTYWPPEPRMGMPGFGQVVDAVAEAWALRREQAVARAGQLTRHLRAVGQVAARGSEITPELLGAAVARLERSFDFTHGGFGGAPKFPRAIDLQVLLRVWSRTGRATLLEMTRLNLEMMARGGIYDHLAGGFARYSVDERWLVPHFEKMLYDNALLTGAYVDAFLVTGDAQFARVARETIDYVRKYMTDESGGFHGTEDADSEGVEGKFYVWTPAEIREALGDERGERFCRVYDVTERGNFEGHCILNLPRTVADLAASWTRDGQALEQELSESRARLLEVRDRRVRPGKDDKVLTSWNALMIDALARAAGVLEDSGCLAAATRAAEFIRAMLWRDDGQLLHCARGGVAKLDAYLDDYACLINALVTLYEASLDETWVDWAVDLAEILLDRFRDTDRGGFFFTADNQETLIARNKDVHDSSVPSGNAMAATALLRLGALTGRREYTDAAHGTLLMALGVMEQMPEATGQMLVAADWLLGPAWEVVLTGPDDEVASCLRAARQTYLPRCVLAARSHPTAAHRSPRLDPLFAGRPIDAPVATMYVCRQSTCETPVTGVDQIIKRLKTLGQPTS